MVHFNSPVNELSSGMVKTKELAPGCPVKGLEEVLLLWKLQAKLLQSSVTSLIAALKHSAALSNRRPALTGSVAWNPWVVCAFPSHQWASCFFASALTASSSLATASVKQHKQCTGP